MGLRLEDIAKAFSPAKEIDDPKLFVGRYPEIMGILEFLSKPGAFLVIFGPRGVGKSSVALQLKRIAEGDLTLVNAMKIDERYIPRNLNWCTVYYRIDSFVSTVENLISRISDDFSSKFFPKEKGLNIKRRVVKKGYDMEGGLSLVRASRHQSEEEVYEKVSERDIISKFRSLLSRVRARTHSQCKSGILIVIDEFDLLNDKRGFASLVKAISSEGFIKFVVVGIAADVSELMDDHGSIGRLIHPLKIPPMIEDDLYAIIKKAEYLVKRQITYKEPAARKIVHHSEGFPYFTHLLGMESMKFVFDQRSKIVTVDVVDSILRKLSEGNLPTLYEEMYNNAVKHSEQREFLLILFAEEPDEVIRTEKIYRIAKESGISNPSQLMQALTAPLGTNRPPVLVKVRDREYRFSDPVFKVYAKLRGFKFSN